MRASREGNLYIGTILLWTFTGVIFLTLFFGLLGMATGVLSLPFRVFNQANRIVDKTIDADNVIYNYEWFKKVCGEIKAQDDIVARAQTAQAEFELSAGERSTWDWNDKNEHAMLRQNVSGSMNTRTKLMNEYNARARMVNRSIFNTEACDVQVSR